MKPIIICTLLLLCTLFPSYSQGITELYKNNQTYTYDELIAQYQKLADTYTNAKLIEYGATDAGLPLQLFVITPDGVFDPDSIKAHSKATILINNAIHPGEPCGVDASLKLAEDLLKGGIIPSSNVVVCIIPAYNIGGMLNRGCCSRANQNGPEEYGFRGNSKNLDLNRDFIKADAQTTKQFYKIYHYWKPQIFVDAHSTDGADYPAQMTLISTARSRIYKDLQSFYNKMITNNLYYSMVLAGYSIAPYYHLFGDSVEQGLVEYMDTPRYSTGYTTLFNSMGYVSEAHMLKPYPIRVEASYALMKSLIKFAQHYASSLLSIVDNAQKDLCNISEYGINYTLDTTQHLGLDLPIYKKKYRTSSVTGLPIHYYDQKDIDTVQIPYYAHYVPTKTIEVPDYYIVPQQWKKVIERLDLNNINYTLFGKDTTIKAECYYISNYKTIEKPYEGHYLHYDTEVRKDTQAIDVRSGDLLVPAHQVGIRYLLETLEPEAEDSFFAWGFFDAVLQQKEWFSDYAFEPKAQQVLDQNPKLKAELELKKKTDKKFASDSWAILYYVYKHSPYYEKTHNRYPRYRLPKGW
jgi:hypothetical protein